MPIRQLMALKALQSFLPNAPMNVIVGVVGDIREDGIAVPPAPYVYTCTTAGSYPDPDYVVRARGNARALMRQVRQVVQQIDPHRAVFGMKTLDSVSTDALDRPRWSARCLGSFAAAAMLLMAAVSATASFLPARRAARIDPLQAMHMD